LEGAVSIFRKIAVSFAMAALTAGVAGPPTAAAGPPGLVVTARLDGKLIPIAEVPTYYCDDFSFPVIQCSVDAGVIDGRLSALLSVTAVDYVTIYDQPLFAGAFMHVSQDYSVLAAIGWNDRISSFKGRNSETGAFNTDWFYGGTTWSFCCNSQVGSLNAYNNTFSSVRRT
jgi:hypothetical protein